MTFEEARAAFPVFERLAYLNAGSFGPLAQETLEAVREQLRADAEKGRSGVRYIETITALRGRAREQIGELLSVSPEKIALTTSTTRACSLVIAGLRLGPGDEVVTTDTEHFGLIGPLHASGARVRVAPVRERTADEALEAILTEIGPRTRLVALSHVSWHTGQRLPLEELRTQVDLPLLVDGAQSAGAIPVNARVFDYYTVSGQKWLCGPDATGGLYVREPDALRVAAPSYFSQDEYRSDGSFVPRAGAARFDSDGIALPALAGLVAAIAGTPEWRFEGAARAAARFRELLLGAGVEVITPPGDSTLVTFLPRRSSGEIVADAHARGVIVRDLPKTPWVRVSCGYWTNEEDLERLVATL